MLFSLLDIEICISTFHVGSNFISLSITEERIAAGLICTAARTSSFLHLVHEDLWYSQRVVATALQAIDNRKVTFIIFFDFSKAFDMVTPNFFINEIFNIFDYLRLF